ncbi:MAG: fibronectin type III domain-containing protein [Treponema sp.]|nr:fibronectin type III domain-containing protein [Treponema sp.]
MLVGSPSSASYTDNGLSAGTTYYYKVSAVNSAGESARSSSAYATTNASSDGASQQEGVYIGIISFAGTATDVTGGVPVFLDSAGKTSLLNKLNSDYAISSQAGTALFYAVHKALANLKSRDTRYPANLDSVNVITFTDGLDNGSTGISAATPIEERTFNSDNEYTTYLNGEIASRTIAGKSITAYSVGVTGNDVADITKFENDLAKIASTGNSQSLTDFGNLQATFQTIADSLQITHTSTTFTMKTTLLASGAKVRMTFDVTGTSAEDAAAASKYIEGAITRTGTGSNMTYTFSGITYAGGLDSDQGAGPITGAINGPEVNFTFTGVSGYDPSVDEAKAKQWTQSPNTTAWQVNSEYDVGGATDTRIERRSSIIYLVLDSSRSLNTTQIGQIRNAAINFIESLYNQLNGGGTTVPSAPTGVTASAQSSSGINVSWNAAPGATSYKVFRASSSSGTYTLVGSPSSASYTDSGLSSSTTYYYKVSAVNSAGESAQSSYASATTSSSSSGYSGSSYANAIALTSSSAWTDGALSASSPAVWYSFYISSGSITYCLSGRDRYGYGGAYTSDVSFEIYDSSLNLIRTIDAGNGNTYSSVTGTNGVDYQKGTWTAGTWYVKVVPYGGSASNYGAYAIYFY